MTSTEPARLILIHPNDNVAVLARSVEAGEMVALPGMEPFAVSAAFALGHKFAVKEISAGEKILKYGVPIGSATTAISIGDHVHLHNLQSDYLPTYTLTGERTYE